MLPIRNLAFLGDRLRANNHRQAADLVDAAVAEIEALRSLHAAVVAQRDMYAGTSDEDNMSGPQISAWLDQIDALWGKEKEGA